MKVSSSSFYFMAAIGAVCSIAYWKSCNSKEAPNIANTNAFGDSIINEIKKENIKLIQFLNKKNDSLIKIINDKSKTIINNEKHKKEINKINSLNYNKRLQYIDSIEVANGLK